MRIICSDGTNFLETKEKCVGSVKTTKGRDINNPPKSGEYPVLVEQFGSYRMFTYNKKIVSIQES
jgi:hypothetical protein